MTVGERERRELQEALVSAIGPNHTDTLLGYLPPVGWADVATKDDLRALSAELRGELHDEIGTLRGEFGTLRGEFGTLRGEFGTLRGEFGELRADVHHQFRVQTYWMISLLLAFFGVVLGFSAAGIL